MKTTEPNKWYAIINQDGEAHLLKGEEIGEQWDENSINIQELPKDFEPYFVAGYRFKEGKWIKPTLEQKKKLLLENFAGWAQAEINYVAQDYIPYGEQDTWAVQYDEALALLSGAKSADELILLPILAAERGKDLQALAQRVVENNKAYNQKVAKIIAQRQNLAKQVEQAKNTNIEFIQWERIYMPPLEGQESKE